MMDSGYRALAAAVCLQAVDDWEKLCKCYAAGLCECTAEGRVLWDKSNRAGHNAYNRMGQTSFFIFHAFGRLIRQLRHGTAAAHASAKAQGRTTPPQCP